MQSISGKLRSYFGKSVASQIDIQRKQQYFGSRYVLPIDNAGLYRNVSGSDVIEPAIEEGKAEFLPLKEISVDAQICDSMATVKIVQVYVNPSNVEPQEKQGKEEEKPIEISYKFPKIADQIIAGMKVSIEDKTIEANIMENEKAQDKYENAVSSGNQAALMKETKGEFLELQIGNIKPGQEAKIEITIVQHLVSTNGAFYFDFPLTYFPQYKSAMKEKSKEEKILFNFSADLKSTNGGFSEIAHPNKFQILDQTIDSAKIQKIDSNYLEIDEDLKISFRLQNMDDTRLMFQKSDKYPGKVAVMASFQPTFTSSVNSNQIAVTAGLLEEQDLPKELESKYQFIFLIDRSGSMTQSNRMQISNDAVILFLQSLPGGCKFGMLGFGSDCYWCAGEINDYNNYSKERAINEAKEFQPNYGGTDILSPLVTASTLESGEYKKRIFVLTDGQVGNKQEIVNYCEQMCAQNDDTKVFTFGIGNGCDQDLVKQVAQAGRGSYSIIGDNNPKDLKAKVINALRKASDPALQNCSLNIGSENFKLGELYRNQAVRCCTIITESNFDKLECTFKSEYNPKTKAALNQTWQKESFKEFVSTDDSLFKLCAKAEIDKSNTQNDEKIKLSIKYQVLCSETSFIGVVKNKDKQAVEMEKVEIKAINYNQVQSYKPQFQETYHKPLSYNNRARLQQTNSQMLRNLDSMMDRGQNLNSCAMKSNSYNLSSQGYKKMSKKSSGFAISNPFSGMSFSRSKKEEPQAMEYSSKKSSMKSSMKSKSMKKSSQKMSMDSCAMESAMDCQMESAMDYQMSNAMGSAMPDYSYGSSASYGAVGSSASYGAVGNGACMAMASSASSYKTKPSFQSFISCQDSIGFWSSSSTNKILEFFDSPTEVKKLINANKDAENIVLTMLAILILETQFKYQKSEWDMICSKAKKWIRQQNLDADRKKSLEEQTKAMDSYFSAYDDMQERLNALNCL